MFSHGQLVRSFIEGLVQDGARLDVCRALLGSKVSFGAEVTLRACRVAILPAKGNLRKLGEIVRGCK
jgi:hypothetical protein